MSARLHLENVVAPVATPTSWLLLAHGMFGSGTNWRGIARKLVAARPAWGVVLVDLRQHGKSEPGEPPHTVAACADDVRAAVAELAARDQRVVAIAGHSFGGKVMMAARAAVAPAQTWILDASPAARPDDADDPRNGALAVLGLMERLPRAWPSRDAFVQAIVAGGHSRVLADWLAMNVVADPSGGYVLRLDLPALRMMITDYCQVDLWAALAAPAPGEVHAVIAERSATTTADDRARLATLGAHVHVHRVAADHWLHLEAPATVIELFVSNLP